MSRLSTKKDTRKVTITAGEAESPAPGSSEVPETESQQQAQPSDAEQTIAELQARVAEEHDRYLRALAEFQNYRRRQEESSASLRRFATRELVLKLLGIIDDFERAVASTEQTKDFDSLHAGLELTLRKLHEMLAGEGVEPIQAVGQKFDPGFHEAVMRVEDEAHDENTVVHELQKGYTMGSEVIRPSRVAVAVLPAGVDADSDGNEQ